MKTFFAVMLLALFACIPISYANDYRTSSFSEEGNNSASCLPNALGGIQCTGSNCDNISLACREGIGSSTRTWQTRSISEENKGGRDTVDGIVVRKNDYMQRCGTSGYITGMTCTGRYCDNIALQCSEFADRAPTNCRWTGYISEENGGLMMFSPNYFAVAMECSGGYCDNKKFLICN